MMRLTFGKHKAASRDNERKKKMKKFISLFLSIILIFSFTACGNTQNSSTVTDSTEQNTIDNVTTESSENSTTEYETSSTESAEQQEDAEASGKILVVYYSASGNTERVAHDIADTLNADTFELVPENPYTEDDLDWTQDGSRVNKEHEDETLRDIPLMQDTVENWDEYDTVFIGYPIWWGIAAWPVNEFVTSNDFMGKTVIPFATSASSGMGESGKLLEEMAGSGDWQEGQRFSSGASTEDVAAWANGLGL